MLFKLLKVNHHLWAVNKNNIPSKVAYSSFQTKTKAKMVRILNVAEKNDAAKSLSDIMSGGRYRRREGFSRFNKIYEFEYNIFNQNSTMTMTSVSGHLLNNDFIGQYRHWNSCSPVELFDAPVAKMCPQNFVDIKRTLEREVRGCQSLVIWTDGDREGENIGFEIIDVCKAVKPSLRVYRARFSEITRAAVQRAVNTLAPPDKNVSDAVDVRMELDLRIGAAFTRFQTLRLKRVFPDVLAEQLISYGSCQFPTLGFVVERYKQVQAFIPEPFWKIRVTQQTDEGLCEFTWKRHRLFDHLACLVIFEHITENPIAEVMSVKSKPKSKWRPVALDTVEMEKLASRKLKIGAKETMQIAEKLYTKGFISYPRTETNIFPKELDLASMVQMQTQNQAWGAFANNILQNGGPRPRNGNKSDKAHPPIHPIKYTDGLQGNEARIYEFIVRHFLACCSEDAKGQETIVEIEINDEQFSASGLMIIARNYLDVYPYDKWNAKVIPVFQVGEQFEPSSIEMNQSETSPPSLLTEADLITLMDKHGIGTDATHAEHIETIKSRLYVGVRPDGKLVPGELGMGLVEGYDAMGYEMSKPHLRSELEADLKRICDGHKNKDVVLRGQIAKYKDVFIEACQQASKIDEALSVYFGDAQECRDEVNMTAAPSPPVMPCPKCGQPMVLKTKKDGKGLYLSCMGFPDCKNATWFPDFVLEAAVDESRCVNCVPGPVQKIKFKFKRGSVPAYMPTDGYVGCVVCDSDLKELLSIKTFSSPSSTNRSSSNDSGVHSRSNSSSNSNSSGRNNSNTSFGSSGTTQSRNYNTQAAQNNRSGTFHDSGFNSNESSSFPQSSSFNNRTNNRTSSVPPRQFQNNSFSNNNNSSRSQNPTGPGLLRGVGNQRSFSVGSQPQSFHPGGGGDADSKQVVCNCNDDAKMLTVKKNGPNCGRQFYTCAKPQDSRCGFFLWADESSEDTASSGGPRGGGGGGEDGWGAGRGNNYRSHSTSSVQGGNSFGRPGSNDAKCNCGMDAKLLTVNKEGPNKGRQFYSCSKPPQDSRCNFFQWADQENNAPGEMAAGGFNRRSSFGGPLEPLYNSSNNGDGVQCRCEIDAKKLTVQKEGPNKGRQFYGCTKPMGQGSCGFFQWADEGSGDNGGGGFGGGGGGGGGRSWGSGGSNNSRVQKEPGAKGKRLCGVCRQEGHNRKNCPQNR